MSETTIDAGSDGDGALGAYLSALEAGKRESAHRMLEADHRLAIDVAKYYENEKTLPRPVSGSRNSPGKRIDQFEILQMIGGGAQGEVFKAHDCSNLDRDVAIKQMRRERSTSASDLERFLLESALLAKLDHPNIVKVYTAQDSEDGPYFAMEFLTGKNLKQKIADELLPTHRQAAMWVRDLAQGMHRAHSAGVIHRDLKSANVILSENGIPKIVDFGLGKKLDSERSISEGKIIGTASYMSPEAARGNPAGVAADVYGLGAILYELLTGRPPFVGATLEDTLKQVRESDPIRVAELTRGVHYDLETICLACLHKDPTKRYASADKLAEDLTRFLVGDAIEARRPPFYETLWRILFREQFTNVAAWGRMLLWMGAIHAVFYPLQAATVATGQSNLVYFLVIGIHQALIPIIFWRGLRGCRLDVGDRQLLSFAIILIAASWLLPYINPPPAGLDQASIRLHSFPLRAFLQGSLLFVMGAVYWGGFYLVGLGWLVLAFVMVRIPQASILIYGLYTASIQLPLGWYLLRSESSMSQDEIGSGR